MRPPRRLLAATCAGALALGPAAPAWSALSALRVQRTLSIGQNVHIAFRAAALAAGGYYYAVVVLEPYRHYTRASPPPCATSSDMQRTDYGFPAKGGAVALALTPPRGRHWCRGGVYEGAIYEVPHSPPCTGAYPCAPEPYGPCVGVAPGCVHGVVVRPRLWSYPQGLPRPRATGAAPVARFTLRFPR